MGRTRQSRPRSRHHLSNMLVAALAALVVMLAAGPAMAGPPGATLDLASLQAKLTVSGPIDGTMKTVMNGTTVTDIPVRVLAIVEASTWGKLIMFESTDPAITQIGGIAAGMSGSPIYVTDGGVDKLIGAVSWGSDFSLRGTGLATPIEYMTAVQDKYAALASPARHAPATVELKAPVRTAAGAVHEIVLAPTAKAAGAVPAAAGQAVMHPLALAEIGGLPASSKAYKTLAAKLESAGLTVIPAQASPLAAGADTPDLTAGSACAVLFSKGFYWMGVLGTVTYVDGNTAMMFGHPILGDPFGMDLGVGALEGALTGATVDAIWPSSMSPQKVMTPADVKGTATQDRSSGVVGEIGAAADLFPVTTDATVDGASEHVVDSTDVGEWFASSFWPGSADSYGMGDPGAAGAVVAAGLYHALDRDAMSGSATTTTTVLASDSSGSYTITRDNVWDADGSYSSLADTAAGDATDIVSSIVNDPYGLRRAHIDSVSVTASLSSSRRSGALVDALLPAPLKVGDNLIDITYYRWGSPDLQTVQATLNIPSGTELDGELGVMSAADAASLADWMGPSSGTPAAPETLAQVKTALESAPTNDDLVVSFTPRGALQSDDPSPAASVNVPTGWVLGGTVTKRTTQIVLGGPGVASLGSPIPLLGMLPNATSDVLVSIYVHTVGTPQPATRTMTVMAGYDGDLGSFETVLPPARHDQVITVTAPAEGNSGLPGSASRIVVVRATLTLGARSDHGKLNLTARVTPRGTGGSVVFQRRVAGTWVKVATVPVKSDGTARLTLTAKASTMMRARFAGSDLNGASAWVQAR
ncbi:MAG TPA: hypothetical protein VIL79_04390 [Thermoleophilia bacterium]